VHSAEMMFGAAGTMCAVMRGEVGVCGTPRLRGPGACGPGEGQMRSLLWTRFRLWGSNGGGGQSGAALSAQVAE